MLKHRHEKYCSQHNVVRHPFMADTLLNDLGLG